MLCAITLPCSYSTFCQGQHSMPFTWVTCSNVLYVQSRWGSQQLGSVMGVLQCIITTRFPCQKARYVLHTSCTLRLAQSFPLLDSPNPSKTQQPWARCKIPTLTPASRGPCMMGRLLKLGDVLALLGAGVGKGRTIAGLVLENWRCGRKRHLWLTIGTDLRIDSRRDLDDVGATDIPLHPLNKLPYGQLDSDKVIGLLLASCSGLNKRVQEPICAVRWLLSYGVSWGGDCYLLSLRWCSESS